MFDQGRLALACRRREFLVRGAGLAAAGFLAPRAMRLRAAEHSAQDQAAASDPTAGRARSCILIYLLGGPPQLDTFDLKPEAPAEIRGPFKPISTNTPGIQICEHLPLLAKQTERFALVRSVSHPNSNHTPMIYYTLTGYHTDQPLVDNDVRPPLRSDFPHLGSVVSKLIPSRCALPGFVALPELAIRSSISGEFQRARSPLRGGSGGFLGAQFDPLNVNGAPGELDAIPALAPLPALSSDRSNRRSALLSVLERARPADSAGGDYDLLREQALVLTGAQGGSAAELFAVDREPSPVRQRYGPHRFGRSLLLARRLTEAGVPMVAIHFNEMTVCDGWDTHSKNFEACQTELLPMLDQGVSALLEDLHHRGRLEQTLVVVMGEFGRTPKINSAAGRDHWGDCSSALLAGGGIRGGQVLGRSDRHAAYPADRRVDPVDIQATMYHALGIDLDQEIRDHVNRPLRICQGSVLHELF